MVEEFKNTDYGVIPNDWDFVPLGDVCVKVQDGNYGESYPKSNEFVKIGVPFLTSKAIGKDGVLKDHLIDFITEEKHSVLAKAHLSLYDVLFTNRGASVGAIGFVDEKIAKGNIGPQLTLLRANKECLAPLYLFQAMKSRLVQKQILGQDFGSAMNFFGIGSTKKFQIPLPPTKTEQTAIATALNDADALITQLEKLIAKKRNIKQGVMQELLTGRKRLPGFEKKKGFQKTEVGIIPNDWELVSYGKVFDFLTTATYSRSQLSESGEIKYVHYGDIHTKCQHFLDCDKIELPSIKLELLKNYPMLKEGDVIVVDASEDYEGVGKSVEVRNIGNFKIISGLHTFLLRDKNGLIANGFKGYIHSNKLVKKQMDTLATGMKVYGVSKTNLKLIKIPLPPTKAEHTAIVQILSDMDAEIEALEKKLEKYKMIKQGMMQNLLTGKIRLG